MNTASRRAASVLWLLSVLAMATRSSGDCSLAKTPKGSLVLENRYLRIVVDPRVGAKATSFRYKTAEVELCGPYGALADRLFVSGKWGKDFWGKPYEHRVVKRSPEEVTVRFTAQGRSPGYDAIRLDKTVSLARGQSRLRVGIRLTNEGKDPTPVCFWAFHNLSDKEANARFFVPTEDGVYVGRRVPRHGSHAGEGRGVVGQDRFIYDPPRAWNGLVADEGYGVATTAENRYLTAEYNWFGPAVTTEWIYNTITIPAGRSWATEYTIVPLRGFTRLDGAADALAGQIELPETIEAARSVSASVEIISGVTGAAEVEIRRAPLAGGAPVALMDRQITLNADEPVALPMKLEGLTEGTHALRVVVRRGEAVLRFERPFVVGVPRGEYRLASDVEKRVGETMAFFDREKTRRELDIPDGYEPAHTVPTPHVRWARPYRLGRIDAIFAVDGGYREIVELGQRLSMNPRVVKPSELPVVLAGRVPEVLVMGGQSWDKLDPAIREVVIGHIESGMGLVFVAGARFSDNGDLWNRLESLARDDAEVFGVVPEAVLATRDLYRRRWRIGALGKGRVVFLHFGQHLRKPHHVLAPLYTGDRGEPTHGPDSLVYEHGYSLVARCLAYAADRLSSHTMRIAIPRRERESPRFARVTVANPRQTDYAWSVSLECRNERAETVHSERRNVTLSPGGRTVAFPLPPLPAGRHAVDVILRDNFGQSVNWRSASVVVERTQTIGSIELDKPSYAAGETMNCSVALANAGERATPAELNVELRDVESWVMAKASRRARLAPGESNWTISLPLELAAHRGHWLRVELVVEGTVVDAKRKLVLVEPAWGPDFLMAAYACSSEPARRLGFNARFGAYVRATKLDMMYVPWYAPWTCDVGLGRERGVELPDLADPEHRQKVAAKVREYGARVEARFRPPFAFVVDEWNPKTEQLNRIASQAEGHRAGFRRFLEKTYGDIAALNRQWETEYKGFEEIAPFTERQHNRRVQEFWRSGRLNFSPWFDHHSYWETLTADYLAFLNREMRAVYPGARLGFSGMGGRLGGNCLDFWKLVGKGGMRCVGMYGGPALELVRSFAPDDFVYTRWCGYDRAVRNEQGIRRAPWNVLLHRGAGCSWYVATTYAPLFAPDWRPYPSGRWFAEENKLINGTGIGRLIRESERLDDGVAIHFSQPSIHAARLADRIGETDGVALLNNDHSSFQAALQDLGLQYTYLSYEQIEAGALKPDRWRTLILPYSQAISDREATAIEGFVRTGGVVIADLKPAVYDEHGRLRQGGRLNEVFGVQQKSLPTYKTATVKGEALFPDVAVAVTRGEEKLTHTAEPSARFEDGAPAVFVNDYGEGKAIFLNFAISDYHTSAGGGVGGEIEIVARAKAAKAAALRKLLSAVLAHAGVEPQTRVVRAGSGGFMEGERIRFRRGDLDMLAIMRAGRRGMILPAEVFDVRVSLPDRRHVYDMIDGQYLGSNSTVVVESSPARPILLALLERPIAAVEVEAPRRATRGATLRIVVRVLPGSDGAVRMTVKAPDGRTSLRRTLLLDDGVAPFAMPVPHNAPAGAWVIEARDTITHRTARAAVLVP